MADKEKLNAMLDALINDKPEDAQIAFHDYLGQRMREEIQGVSQETPRSDDNDD